MSYREIAFWGDSITKGVIYDEARARYAILRENAVRLLSQTLALPVVNHSQMGRTAPQGLEAMRNAEADMDGALVVLAYGGNDCDFNWAKVAEAPEDAHVCATPENAFAEALEGLVSLVRARGGTPIFSSLPPLDAHRYFDWITRGGLSKEAILRFIGVPERIYRWQEYYSALVMRIARQLGCACLPIREALLRDVRGEDVLCLDGIHPNAVGHRMMADALADILGSVAPTICPVI